MNDVGPAAWTLGAVYRVAGRDGTLFHAVRKIAAEAGLPAATTRKQLQILVERGWLANLGRQRSPSGRPRRTATYRLTPKARRSKSPYVVLPRYVTPAFTDHGRHSAALVYALIVSRWTMIEEAMERCGRGCVGPGEADVLDGRQRISLAEFGRRTGLSRPTIVESLRLLEHWQLIDRNREDRFAAVYRLTRPGP